MRAEIVYDLQTFFLFFLRKFNWNKWTCEILKHLQTIRFYEILDEEEGKYYLVFHACFWT